MENKKNKIKRILFVSTRNPKSKRFSGDVIQSNKIINILKKKNFLDVVTLDQRENFSKKNMFIFKRPVFILQIFYVIKCLLCLRPLQLGLFYSKDMKKFIDQRALNYDLIFFYHIRSAQYLPKNYYGKTIIEMGDLYSDNYKQTFDNLSLLNPLKYIYYLESILVNKLEKEIFKNFDKIVLFSKIEIKKIDKFFLKKIIHINISIDKIFRKYTFSKNEKKILFIGNLNYLPNILAVKSFIKDILPKLKKNIPDIQFEIVGQINKLDRYLLSFNKNVKCWGAQRNLEKFIKGSFCGIANLKIASGIQSKVLSYMSYGLPVICSKKVASNFNKNVISYTDDNDFINKIRKLKNDKKFNNQIAKKSLRFVNKFTWSKVQKEYLKIT